MEHKHKYDAHGNKICCTQTEKVYTKAGAKELVKEEHHKNEGHNHGHNDDDGHDHNNASGSPFKMFFPSILSLLLLLIAIAVDNWMPQEWFKGTFRFFWY